MARKDPIIKFSLIHFKYFLAFVCRRECDQVSQDLRRAGIMSEPYHAGLSDSARIEVQERWLNEDKCKVGGTKEHGGYDSVDVLWYPGDQLNIT